MKKNKQAITKRIIGLITAMLTVSIAVPMPAWAEAGDNESEPIEISDQAGLEAFRTAVNEGNTYEGKFIKLTASITLSNWTASIGGIPNDNKPFLGTFDGQGYVITMTGSASLFARIGNEGSTIGTVKNLGVAGTLNNTSNDTGAQSIGGIVTTNYGTIEQCYTSATISSSYGFAGGIADANKGTIRNCYSTGAITSSTRSAGGIASTNSAGYTIQNCYSTGAVTASTNTSGYSYNAGGIVGNNPGSIQNCIALNASISGSSKGRIAGASSGTISGNYASPTISGTWSEDVINGTALTAENFTGQTAGQGVFANWSDGNWDFTNTANLPILKDFKGDPAQPTSVRPTIAPALIKEIKDADDLAAFRDAVNSGETYEGETVTLANDITVTGWTTGIGIEESNNNNKPFSGTFDGQGHVITLTGSASLFAIIGNSDKTIGTVQNLGVKATITANTNYAGGIVGQNFGTVQNCYTEGAITNEKTSYYTGSIIGLNEGTILNCYSTASCTTNSYAGGIAGKNSGTIQQCYATGTITGESAAGGIAGTWQGSNITLKNCIALNTEGITATSTSSAYRVGNKGLSANFASPLIPGTWNNKGADNKDGADLTEANFLTNATDEGGAFKDWSSNNWDFGDNSTLPKLKTTGLTPDIVIGGQGDDSGNMPARAGFLEQIIEISTSVTYDEATHNGKQIRVLNGGIFTVATDGASFKKLTIEEGGQVVAPKAFTCIELLAPYTLSNKWTAYGSPVEMKAVAKTSQKFYRLSGYKNTSNQSWSSDGSTTGTSFSISTLNLIATEADNVSVTLKAPVTGNDPVTIPVDGTATTGSALNTGTFLFCANPTLKNVTIPVAYILSADGTRFERTENAVVKPFQSYVVANAAKTASILSLRAGGIPTANEPITLPDDNLRLWGSNGQLHLSADSPCDVTIYNLGGCLIRRITLNGAQTLSFGCGIYLVHSNNITYKVSL